MPSSQSEMKGDNVRGRVTKTPQKTCSSDGFEGYFHVGEYPVEPMTEWRNIPSMELRGLLRL